MGFTKDSIEPKLNSSEAEFCLKRYGSVVKRGLLALGLLVPFMANAQPNQSVSDPISVPPQMTVVVRKHNTGADLVEITMLQPQYPLPLLQAQCTQIGVLTGSPVRGLTAYETTIDPKNPKLSFVKAQFATDHLIDNATGALRLEPIVRAFAGAPAPNTIYNMMVSFAAVTANEKTVKHFLSDKVVVVGRSDTGTPPGVEYRIAILKQDSEGLRIPESVSAPEAAPAPESARSNTVLIWSLVAIAAVATGALVYFALLRTGRRPTPK